MLWAIGGESCAVLPPFSPSPPLLVRFSRAAVGLEKSARLTPAKAAGSLSGPLFSSVAQRQSIRLLTGGL